jgi:hypothetical protein
MDFNSSEEIRAALQEVAGTRVTPGSVSPAVPLGETPSGAWVDIPPYQCDALVRGSEALAKTKDGRMVRTVI